MKKLTYKLAGLMMALAIIFSALDISIAQKEKSIQGNTTIELNGFSVVSPSGDDWKYFITPDKNTVQFMFEYSNIQTEKRIQHLQLYSKIPCLQKLTKVRENMLMSSWKRISMVSFRRSI